MVPAAFPPSARSFEAAGYRVLAAPRCVAEPPVSVPGSSESPDAEAAGVQAWVSAELLFVLADPPERPGDPVSVSAA